MAIKIDHLNYVYSEGTAFEKHALKDVNLEIPDGQFIGVIGHTGSGKSTLIQHLNGLLKGTSGAIYYNGTNIYGEGYNMKELRSKVGWYSSIRSTSCSRSMYLQTSASARRISAFQRRRSSGVRMRHCGLSD